MGVEYSCVCHECHKSIPLSHHFHCIDQDREYDVCEQCHHYTQTHSSDHQSVQIRIPSHSSHNPTVLELAHLRSDLKLFSSVSGVSTTIHTLLDKFAWNAPNIDEEDADEEDEEEEEEEEEDEDSDEDD